jgi:hypothetical protein
MKNDKKNKKQHHHLDREIAFVNAGPAQIKISTIPKEIPLHTYSIGHQRTDHESGETYFAPYVRHDDLPAVIEELQKVWKLNQDIIDKKKTYVQREYREGEQEASSWRKGKDKDSKRLRRLEREAQKARNGEPAPLVDSEQEREKNARTFAGKV